MDEIDKFMILAFLLMVIMGIGALYISEDRKAFCESKGGYNKDDKFCYIKEDGKWKAKEIIKIRDNWELIDG